MSPTCGVRSPSSTFRCVSCCRRTRASAAASVGLRVGGFARSVSDRIVGRVHRSANARAPPTAPCPPHERPGASRSEPPYHLGSVARGCNAGRRFASNCARSAEAAVAVIRGGWRPLCSTNAPRQTARAPPASRPFVCPTPKRTRCLGLVAEIDLPRAHRTTAQSLSCRCSSNSALATQEVPDTGLLFLWARSASAAAS